MTPPPCSHHRRSHGKGGTAVDKGEKGLMAADEEKRATMEGKGEKWETGEDEKGAVESGEWKWKGATVADEGKGAAMEVPNSRRG